MMRSLKLIGIVFTVTLLWQSSTALAADSKKPMPVKGDTELTRDEIIDNGAGEKDALENLPPPYPGTPMQSHANARAVQEVFDVSSERDNGKIYQYSPESTYKVRLREFLISKIVLPADEKIVSYALGDSEGFHVTPDSDKLKNQVYVKGDYPGTDTSLIITAESGRVYSFYLRCDPVSSPEAPTIVVYVKTAVGQIINTVESAEDDKVLGVDLPDNTNMSRDQRDYLQTLPNRGGINVNYKIRGGNDAAVIAPFGVYDDGNFTYFDYRGQVGDRLPALFRVVDGFDSTVNYRMENGFMVAESLGTEGWTLISGNKVICVKPSVDLLQYWREKTRKKVVDEEIPFRPVKGVRAAPQTKSEPAKPVRVVMPSGPKTADELNRQSLESSKKTAPSPITVNKPAAPEQAAEEKGRANFSYDYPTDKPKKPLTDAATSSNSSFVLFNRKIENTYPKAPR